MAPGAAKLGIGVLFIDLLNLLAVQGSDALWSQYWWTYDGISGPDMWGSKWSICRKGKYQSPIDIRPDRLLFDPQLQPIVFSHGRKINGNLTNTGNDITLFVDTQLLPHLNVSSGPLQYTYHLHQIKLHFGDNPNINGNLTNTGNDITLFVDTQLLPHLNVSSGPLQYTYHLHQIKLHFGEDNETGSEHTINSLSFPAELQILAYNADLYNNYTHALASPNGIAAFAIFLEIGDTPNEAFTMIADFLKDIPARGDQKLVNDLPLNILLPKTPQFITYEGSLTQPGCQETVTWVIFNKPIYVLDSQLEVLRQLFRESGGHLLLSGNIRPSMPVNNRLLRTNISYRPNTKACSMAKEVFYEVNTIKPRNGR